MSTTCQDGASGTGKLRVGLVQINNSFSNQNYFPLSVGTIQAYAQRHLRRPDAYEFLLPVYSRMPIDAALERIDGADAVFFSAYVWNFRISLEVAKRYKAKHPEAVIVFGGPHVPDRSDQLLRSNRFIDLACHGEGELVGHAVLEALPLKNWKNVPSISFIDDNSELVRTMKAPRLSDLGKIPSPYLEGVFDPLVTAFPDEQWIGLWETNRGCPFACTFCDWGSAVQSKVYQFDIDRLRRELEWFADRRIEFVFCCDANFGILPRDIDIARYAADLKRERGYPHALSVQSTKNATDRAYTVQKILADAGLNKGVAVALQSINPTTLVNIKRSNISTATYQELQRRFTRDDVETYTDLILGLPGDTYDSFVESVSTIIANGQHNRIQFNNLSILPNAEMGDPEYQRRFGMKTVESAIINIHGSLAAVDNETIETQQLVIATESMPEPDWVKARAFAWSAGLLYFDKILQIPFVLLHELVGLDYRNLLEAFSGGPLRDCPILEEIRSFFIETAHGIQRGGPEYCRSEQWLNIWWPADEYVLIKLCTANRLNAFYEEAESRLAVMVAGHRKSLPPGLLHDAIELNRAMIKLPFLAENVEVGASYNIWEYYQGTLRGKRVALESVPTLYQVDRTSRVWNSWDEWCREVIWYGNKKGAYLYGNEPVGPQLAGHF